MSTASQTHELIDFLSNTQDFPDQVLHEAKRCLLGFFAAAFAGIRSPIWQNARQALDDLETAGQHPIIGSARRYRAEEAAFLNAIAGNVLDFDDTHIPTIIHPSSPLMPVLLSHAGSKQTNGKDFLRSIVVGIELMCRLGMATHPDAYRRGFHVTATCGTAGASVAHGLLLNMTEQQLTDCLALGCNTSSGLIVNLATPAKAISVGYAARHAVTIPTFVLHGITGALAPMEGSFGFLQAMSNSSNPTWLTSELGSRWEILQVAQKPYPTGVVLNPVIDASLAFYADADFDVNAVQSVEVYGHPLLKDRADRAIVGSTPDARLSVQHTVAVTLLRGLPGTAAFEEPAYRDADVQRLAHHVSVHVDDSIDVESCRIDIKTTTGQTVRQDIACGRGSLKNPLSDEDLELKCRISAADLLSDTDLTELMQDIWQLEQMDDVGQIMRHLF